MGPVASFAPEGWSGLRAIDFLDWRVGRVACNKGVILKTEDGGLTWTDQTEAPRDELGKKRNLLGIRALSSRIAIAVGEEGLWLATGDGGSTWIPIDPNESGWAPGEDEHTLRACG